MNPEMIAVLLILLAAAILFVLEKIPTELTAMIVLAALVASSILTVEEGLSGFGNQATVTVGAMFILSAALKRTGAVAAVGTLAARIFRFNFWAGLLGTMLLVAVISAFINNTPVVAIFIPIMLRVGMDSGHGPSRLLMPVSFASIFGGTCTLIGTSTNILVSSIAVQRGLEPLGMFEFASLGLVFFAAGTLYMMVFGVRAIPDRGCCAGLVEKYRMNQYLTDVELLPESASVGKRLPESPIVSKLEIDVLDVIRGGRRLLRPLGEIVLEAGDILRVRCDIEQIRKLQESEGIRLKSRPNLEDGDFDAEQLLLVEAIVAPGSGLIGKNIKSARFRNRFQANALAVRHRGQLFNLGFREMPLAAGDAILVEVRQENYEALKNDEAFVIVSDIAADGIVTPRRLTVFAIVAAVVASAALGVLPIAVAAIAGCLLLVLSRLVSVEEALQAVDWRILLLLAGMIPLGVALEKTGTAALLAHGLVGLLRGMGPVAVIAALYLLTSLLTEVMSNNATAVLLAPIAIGAAVQLGLDPKPFIMAVAFAASASFMTPIGYQTNTMIYGVGQYRFADFVKVGAPLNLLFWALASFLIPVFYPF